LSSIGGLRAPEPLSWPIELAIIYP